MEVEANQTYSYSTFFRTGQSPPQLRRAGGGGGRGHSLTNKTKWQNIQNQPEVHQQQAHLDIRCPAPPHTYTRIDMIIRQNASRNSPTCHQENTQQPTRTQNNTNPHYPQTHELHQLRNQIMQLHFLHDHPRLQTSIFHLSAPDAVLLA
jgi:hypothetical protein